MVDARRLAAVVFAACVAFAACAEAPASPEAPRRLDAEEIASVSMSWTEGDLGPFVSLVLHADGSASKRDDRPRGRDRRGVYEAKLSRETWRDVAGVIAEVPVVGEQDVWDEAWLLITTRSGDLHDLAGTDAPELVNALQNLDLRLGWRAPRCDVPDDARSDRIVTATFTTSFWDDFGKGDSTVLRIEADGTATIQRFEGVDFQLRGTGRAAPQQTEPFFAFLRENHELFASSGQYGDRPGVDPPRFYEVIIERADGIHVEVSSFGASGPPALAMVARAAADLADHIRWEER